MIEKRSFIWVSLLAVILVAVPYIFAFLGGNEQWVFGGFLLNPIDGHSYLAKMQQGFQGNWKFVLPYTAESGEGAYLFLFYIGLGHLGRIFNIPLILIFHAFRLFGAFFLLFSIWKLSINLFKEIKYQLIFFCLAVFGSGLGWAGVLAGQFTSDFWVAEAYPFLSMYGNPHFPLGMGIMILMLLPGEQGLIKSFIAGLILSIVQPFAVVIVLIIYGVTLIREAIDLGGLSIKKIWDSTKFQNLVGAGLSGGSILLYQYYSILNDPILSVWNAQNLTPPPAFLDFIIAFSPVLILTVLGVKPSLKSESGKIMLTWAITSLVLVLIPWNLQRRFLSGIYVPLSVLAIFGMKELIDKYQLKLRTIGILLLILVVPTNLIVLASGIQASLVQDKSVYISAGLARGLDWVSKNTDPGDIFLTNKTVGLLIPSITGRKVVYGHPFETVNANVELDFINSFFDEQLDERTIMEYLEKKDIEFVLVQKGFEFYNGKILTSNGFDIVFENSNIILFQDDSP